MSAPNCNKRGQPDLPSADIRPWKRLQTSPNSAMRRDVDFALALNMGAYSPLQPDSDSHLVVGLPADQACSSDSRHGVNISHMIRKVGEPEEQEAVLASRKLVRHVPRMIGSDVVSLAGSLNAALTTHLCSDNSHPNIHHLVTLVREFCTRREHVGLVPQHCIRSILKASLQSMLRRARQPIVEGYQDFSASMSLSVASILEQVDPLAVCKVALALEVDESTAACWLVAFSFKFLSVALTAACDNSAHVLALHLRSAARASASMTSAAATSQRAAITLKQVSQIAPDLASIKNDISSRAQAAATALASMEALASRTQRAARWARLQLPTPATRARRRAATQTAKMVAHMREIVSDWAVAEAKLSKLEAQAKQSASDSKALIHQCKQQLEESAMIERTVVLDAAALASTRNEQCILAKACRRLSLGSYTLVVANSARRDSSQENMPSCMLDSETCDLRNWVRSANSLFDMNKDVTVQDFQGLLSSGSFPEVSPAVHTFLEPMRPVCAQLEKGIRDGVAQFEKGTRNGQSPL